MKENLEQKKPMEKQKVGTGEMELGFSILMVDDDKLLVEKYKDTVNWAGLGISVVLTAYNIRQAKALLQEYSVDILLCDIDMPQGSGLELLEWIRDREQEIECIFLSSYANFAYAQAAVRYSARDYLLKPVSNAGLESRIAQVTEEILKRRNRGKSSPDNWRRIFWSEFLRQGSGSKKLLEAALQDGRYERTSPVKLVIVRAWVNPEKEDYKRNITLYDFVLHNVAAEIFQSAGKQLEAIVGVRDYEWVLVLGEMEDTFLRECFVNLKRNLEQSVFEENCVYIGEDGQFQKVEKLLDKLEYVEKNAVDDGRGMIRQDEWVCRGDYPDPPWEQWNRMLKGLGTRETVKEEICLFLEKVQRDSGWKREYLLKFLQELTLFLFQYSNHGEIDTKQMSGGEALENKKYNAMISLENMKQYVRYLFGGLEEFWKQGEQGDNVIEVVKEYIEQYLGEEISRSLLAEKACLSEDYLSKLFARETGMSIPNYIASRRMEKAKEYLDNTSLTIGEVALKVGYSNFSYFSKTFREMVGCTPNEYRGR